MSVWRILWRGTGTEWITKEWGNSLLGTYTQGFWFFLLAMFPTVETSPSNAILLLLQAVTLKPPGWTVVWGSIWVAYVGLDLNAYRILVQISLKGTMQTCCFAVGTRNGRWGYLARSRSQGLEVLVVWSSTEFSTGGKLRFCFCFFFT